ncbi:MAG: vWA domain-containing protein [Rubripirellula sp.]
MNKREQMVWRGTSASNQVLRRSFASLGWVKHWTTMAVMFVCLFVGLIWLLLNNPKKTPLVILTAGPYSQPMHPNAWVQEDIEKLSWLDQKTLHLITPSGSIRSTKDFDQQLFESVSRANQFNPERPLIVWISMHGITCVEDQDQCQELYLITPDATLDRKSGWIELGSVLEELKERVENRQVLLVLDCQKMEVNWDIGLLDNQVSEVFNKSSWQLPHNVAIFLAAGQYQRAHVSPDLRGSIFAHYFRQGLAGAADQSNGKGQSDGWVSLLELEDYVSSKVALWTFRNRSDVQKPMLIRRGDSKDYNLARSIGEGAVSRLEKADQRLVAPQPSLSDQVLNSLWAAFDQIRSEALYQVDPIGWANLERNLIMLERMSVAGSAYKQSADELAFETENQLRNIEKRLRLGGESPPFAEIQAIISGDFQEPPSSLQVHTEPLKRYFDSPSQQSRASVTPSGTDTQGNDGEASNSAYTAAAHFARMLQRYQINAGYRSLSEDEGVSLEELQFKFQKLAVPATNSFNLGDQKEATRYDASGRVHHWTRSWLSSIAPIRRQAEDRLFLTGQPDLEGTLSELQNGLCYVENLNSEIAKRLYASDYAMATASYYARWATDPVQAQSSEKSTTYTVSVNRLLEVTQQLADELLHPSEVDLSTQDLEFGSACNKDQQKQRPQDTLPIDHVTSVHLSLKAMFEKECDELSSNVGPDPSEKIGKIQAALNVPLLTAASRADLRSRLRSLTASVRQVFLDHESSDSPESQDTDDLIDAESAWQASKLVARKTADERFSLLQEMAGGLDLNSRIFNNRQRHSGATAEEALEQVINVSSRARDARFLSSFSSDVIERALQNQITLNMRRLLEWHAESTLFDFWGAAGSGFDFYHRSTLDYLKGALLFSYEGLNESEIESIQSNTSSIHQSLENAQKLSGKWCEAALAKIPLQIESGEPVQITGSIKPLGQSSSSLLIPGQAACFLQLDGVRLWEPGLGAIDLNHDPYDLDFSLPGEVADRSGALMIRTAFRGHEIDLPLGIGKVGGFAVVAEPEKSSTAKATLGKRTDNLSLSFVLDCSSSMRDQVSSSSIIDPAASSSRMDLAKVAMQDLMLQLRRRDGTKVAVHFFGHRIGWSTDLPIRNLINPAFTGQVPQDLAPNHDVETILPLRNLNLDGLSKVLSRLQSVQPWGQSPLYFSILQALDEFPNNDGESVKHLVVITDGANYQYSPPEMKDERQTSLDDVLHVVNKKLVPVHILGLGMDPSHDGKAMSEFARVSVESGGTFQTLDESDLSKVLREIINAGRYKLDKASGEEVGQADIGKAIQFALEEPSRELGRITYLGPAVKTSEHTAGSTEVSETLLFQGGENYQLYIDDIDHRIYSFPFDENVASSAPLKRLDGENSGQVIRAHQPVRPTPTDVVFPISWQAKLKKPDGTFRYLATPKPERIWIAIQPLLENGEKVGDQILAYDRDFQKNQPVPLVQVKVRDWPEQASKVKLRIYSQCTKEEQQFKVLTRGSQVELIPAVQVMELPPPKVVEPGTAGEIEKDFSLERPPKGVVILPLANAPTDVEVAGDSLSVACEWLPEDSLEKPGYQRLRIIIRAPDTGIPAGGFQVSLAQSNTHVAATKIVRRYDSSHNIAVHSFYFPDTTDLPEEVVISEMRLHQDVASRTDQDDLVIELSSTSGYSDVTEESVGSRMENDSDP